VPAHRPLLLAHRGARTLAPENTLEAFERALACGCDGFEFDVRRSGDGFAVVVHDAEVAGVSVGGSDLARLRAAASAPLPLLHEVWQHFHTRAYLDVELKVCGLADEVARLWREHPPGRGGLVSSFSPEALHEVHRAHPGIPLGYICRDPGLASAWRTLPITHAVFQHALLGAQAISELQEAGQQVIVWTLNDVASLRRFCDAGAAALISDDAPLLVRTLRASPRADGVPPVAGVY
jgi:glycerophosphoryl diester phosphodiesterase